MAHDYSHHSVRNPHVHNHDNCKHDREKELTMTLDKITRAVNCKEYQTLRQILSLPQDIHESEFYWFMQSFPPHRRSGMEVAFMKEKGNALFASGQYQSAIDTYESALRIVVKKEYEFLSSSFINLGYTDALQNHRQWTLMLDMVACCNNIAQSYLKLGDRVKAIDWLNEVEAIYLGNHLKISLVETGDMTSGMVEFYTLRMKAALRLAQVFLELGNNAVSSYLAYVSNFVYPLHFPKGVPEINKLAQESNFEERLKFRSPNIKILNEWDVSDARLQIRGVWTKLNVDSFLGPGRRECMTCWIWRNRLYVFGGVVLKKGTRKFTDLWYLDMRNTYQWQRLPDLPEDLLESTGGVTKAIIYENQAYFFNGRMKITRYNLLENTWGAVTTTGKQSDWPFQDDITLLDPSIELYKSFLFVFGGDQSRKNDGLDVLFRLDMRTFEWQQIAAPDAKNTTNWPHSRRAAASWVIPSAKRLYILYGSTSYPSHHGEVADVHAKHLEDFWSYSIPENTWRRERLRGNYPSPRDLLAAVYHEALDVVIAYGGYNQLIPTTESEDSAYDKLEQKSYTYYGDTFIMEPSSHSWRQVVSRTIPAWRTATNLLIDKDTSDVYLFGGSCNYAFLDVKKKQSEDGKPSLIVAFSDLWQLKLDLLGCSFDKNAFSSLSPLKAGAWRRCYACKLTGKGYMKCQGSCNGRYVFCSYTCQRAAWPIHKNVHGCRRL